MINYQYDHCVNRNIIVYSCIYIYIHRCCNIFNVNIQLMAGPSIKPIYVDKLIIIVI